MSVEMQEEVGRYPQGTIDCLAVSNSANFYPEMDEPENYSGDTILWTFELPKSAPVGAGVYRLTFVRTLAEEEALGNPVGIKIK